MTPGTGSSTAGHPVSDFDRFARLAACATRADEAVLVTSRDGKTRELGGFPVGRAGGLGSLAAAVDRAAELGCALVLNDTAGKGGVRAGLEDAGTGALLCVPLPGDTPGGILVTTGAPREWTGEDVEVLEEVASLVASRLSRELTSDSSELRAGGERPSRSTRVLESITDAFFVLDHEWCFSYLNGAAERLLDRSRSSILGTCIWSEFPDAAGSRFEDEFRQAVASGTSVHFEAEFAPLRRWFAVNAYPSAEGLSVYFRDITARRRAEEKQAIAEEHYRRLVGSVPVAVFALDRDGRFLELNPAAEQVVGRPASGLLGKSFTQVIDQDRVAATFAVFADVIAGTRDEVEFEAAIRRPTGEERILLVTAAALREQQEVTGLYGVARDVTEDLARDARQRLLASTLDSLGEGIFLITQEGEYLYANRTYRTLLGIGEDRRDSFRIEQFTSDDTGRRSQRENMRIALETGRWSGRIRRRRLSDGAEIELDLTLGRVPHGDGQPDVLFGIIRDARESIEREQQLRRAERLAGTGTLIRGVAHELNNPLNSIMSFAELLGMDEDDAERREDLEIIRREAARMAKIVADLREAARSADEDRGTREPLDLNALVTRALQLRSYSLHTANIEVESDLEIGLPPVLADRARMEQMIVNLVVNSEQALEKRESAGRLTVATRATAAGVTLRVADDGEGIDAELLPRIFDPFFTTRDPGEGTGLGLSLVHSVVEEHGGRISVESLPGEGTEVRIRLPRAPSVSDSVNEPDRRDAAGRSGYRVLVVDDESSIRRVLSRHLTRLGHAVDEAGDGHAAIAMIDRNGYDVILSDIRMPGLGGEGLLRNLLERGLQNRVAFMTGDASGEGELMKQSGATVLLKPVELEAVARVVERLGDTARSDEVSQGCTSS
jgi:PAS domain S-box-containing protein